MKTITTTLYKFKELSPEIQQKVLSNLCDINVMHDWWNPIYEDAQNIGLRITDFYLDENRYARGEFLLSDCEVAENILKNHGNQCKTYTTAESFLKEWQPIFNDYMDENSENYESLELDGKLQDLENNFLKNILEKYAIILQKEFDYLMSEKSVKETIEANEYTFESNGTLRNL